MCYNKNRRPSDLNNRHLFPTVLEAGKFNIQVPPDSIPGESPLPGFQIVTVLCLILIKPLIPLWGLHSHDPINPNYLPNVPYPNTTILSFMVWIFQGDTIQSIAPCDTTVLKLLCCAQSCSTLCDPLDCSPWNSPGKNTGPGCHFLLQGIFPTQVFCIAGWFFTLWATRGALFNQ